MNILCTICSDLINQAESIFVTKCGHIFHYHCLSQWIERSKSCPQCRNKVTEKCMFRVFPTIYSEAAGEDAATLQSRLDNAQLQMRQQKAECQAKDNKLNALTADLKNQADLIKSYEKKLVSRDSAITGLKEQLDYVKIQNKETNRLREENQVLNRNLQMLNGLQKVLNATSDEVEKMIQSYTDLRTIALFATSLKRALCDSEAKKNDLRDRLLESQKALNAEQSKSARLQTVIYSLEDRLAGLTRKCESLKKRTAPEWLDSPAREESRHKQARSQPPDLNTAMLEDLNTTVSSAVERIQASDSPYLQLKQGNLALAMLQKTKARIPDTAIKPSELAMIKAARNPTFKSENPLSIFHKKEPLKPPPFDVPQIVVTCDGMGGQSKPDEFPKPKPRPPKSFAPKLSSKHKLKRPPAPSGSQDIGKLFERMSQDS